MQKIFNYTCIVAAMLCLFSFAMPSTYADDGDYVGKLTGTVETITSLAGTMQDTLVFFTETFDDLVDMGTSTYNWIRTQLHPFVSFLNEIYEWIADVVYKIANPGASEVPMPDPWEGGIHDNLPPDILPDYDVT